MLFAVYLNGIYCFEDKMVFRMGHSERADGRNGCKSSRKWIKGCLLLCRVKERERLKNIRRLIRRLFCDSTVLLR